MADRVFTPGSEGYPARLARLASPPRSLYLAGSWEHDGPIIAVVGGRDANGDGLDFADWLAAELAGRDAAIVSGLARGIDAAAHRGALRAGGKSGAVLGTALDSCYPRGHESLQDQLRGSLGLMSELPPGTTTSPSRFAARNRIVAALADVVVVVQGRKDSGALHTAREAARLGIRVGAVPWDPREPLSEAPNELIRSGAAALIRDAEDVLALTGPVSRPALAATAFAATALASPTLAATARPRAAKIARGKPPLADVESRALAALRSSRAQSLDQVAERAGLSAAAAGAALLSLELAGLARREPGGFFRRSSGG
jgi:DNA processing protein